MSDNTATIKDALARAVAELGVDLLRNPMRTAAVLKDYAPKLSREIGWVQNSLGGDVGSILIAAMDQSETEQRRSVNLARRQLMDNLGMAETVSRMVVEAIAFALEIKVEEPDTVAKPIVPAPVIGAEEETDAAKLYERGRCCYETQDYKQAVQWFQKAAEQGYAKAQYDLGLCYENGTGVTEDLKQEMQWLQKAAEQGLAEAQVALGNCYRWAAKDGSQAVKWFRKAADQGDTDAMWELATCYDKDGCVELDYKEAVLWYRKAAEQGCADAQYSLGYCYYYGKGVRKNYDQAVKWYRKAADQGNRLALTSLGQCYEHGNGVIQDYHEAARLYRKAVDQGCEIARISLAYLSKYL